MTSADKEAVTLDPWMIWIGLATLGVVAAMAAFTVWDATRTASLEVVETPTAVGDASYVQEPATKQGPIGLKYQGRKLDMVSESKVRDSKVTRVGTDDSGVYWLYVPEDPAEALPKDKYYMKTATNEFIEVTQE